MPPAPWPRLHPSWYACRNLRSMFKVGSGSLQYELVEGWEQLPSGFKHADVAGVCSDSNGNVYLLCRGDHPVAVSTPGSPIATYAVHRSAVDRDHEGLVAAEHRRHLCLARQDSLGSRCESEQKKTGGRPGARLAYRGACTRGKVPSISPFIIGRWRPPAARARRSTWSSTYSYSSDTVTIPSPLRSAFPLKPSSR